MRKLFLLALTLVAGLAVKARADLDPSYLSWLNGQEIYVPSRMTANQQKGLMWMMGTAPAFGKVCSAGTHTVYGISTACIADPVTDINTYLDNVVAYNLSHTVGK